jgi:peptidoglycan/xylan/chitin deacetylase (PgdA/CDA1 family)
MKTAVILVLVAMLAGANAAAEPKARWQKSPEEVRSEVSLVRAGADLTPDVWPDGARVAVGLSFDVDTELVWLTDEGSESPSTMSRGEYGARTGLPRVLGLLAAHDVPATFFIPSMSMALHPEMVKMIQLDERHEIGFHSYAHENPLQLSAADERSAYEKGVALFVEHVGKRPTGFRSAAWDLTPATINLVKALGFTYDSSMMADDRPYLLVSGGDPTGLVELPVEWILDERNAYCDAFAKR